VLVHAEDGVWTRSHTALFTSIEASRGSKDLHVCGMRTPWDNSALALAIRSSQRTVPHVQVLVGRVQLGWPTRSLVVVFTVSGIVLAATAVASMGAIPNSRISGAMATPGVFASTPTRRLKH
jgi:hypothetical protein